MVGMSMVQKVIGQYEQCQAVNGKLEAFYLCDGSLKNPREPPLVQILKHFPQLFSYLLKYNIPKDAYAMLPMGDPK